MVKISVIVPCFNTEKYLRECLDSVLIQTLKDIEIICINDGSPDSSEKIIREYINKDDRVKIINQKNLGVGISRNNGIKAADGEFVAFLDSDDFYPAADILETLYNAAVNNNVLICGGEFSSFEDGKLFQNYKENLSGYLFEKDEKISYRNYQFDYGYHRFIYNRRFLIDNNIFYPNYVRFQDPPFFVNAMIQAKEFFAIDKITYAFRIGHKIFKWNDKKITDNLKGIRDVLYLAKKHKLTLLQKLEEERFVNEYLSWWFVENYCFRAKIELLKIAFLSPSLIRDIFALVFSPKRSYGSDGKIYKIINLGIKLKIRDKDKEFKAQKLKILQYCKK